MNDRGQKGGVKMPGQGQKGAVKMTNQGQKGAVNMTDLGQEGATKMTDLPHEGAIKITNAKKAKKYLEVSRRRSEGRQAWDGKSSQTTEYYEPYTSTPVEEFNPDLTLRDIGTTFVEGPSCRVAWQVDTGVKVQF